MEKLNQYIEENKERFLNELFELIRIPSISSEVEHKPDMYRCAEKWKSPLLAAGADKAEVETEGNPVTYGEKNHRSVSADCIGIRTYGRYACRSGGIVAYAAF